MVTVKPLRLVLSVALLCAAACSSPAPGHVPGVNRDLHGPPDIESYIASLRDEARVHELRPADVARALELRPDAHVADLGCGPGVFALPLGRSVPEGVVYAVDVEPSQLDALRARMTSEGAKNIVPVLASYDDPHLPPARIDLCLVSDTYHHIENRVPYFERLREDMSGEGRLALIEYRDGDLPVGPPAERKIPRATRHAELQAAGWELSKVHSLHEWHEFEEWRPR